MSKPQLVPTITQDDILDALRQAIEDRPTVEGPAGITVGELAEATGRGQSAARREMKRLLAQGKAEPVRVVRTDMAGRVTNVPGYRPK